MFVNGAKGLSTLQLSRDLGCQYKTVFVMAHKIREAMFSEANGAIVSGTVGFYGAYLGGHVRPDNNKVNRRKHRFVQKQTARAAVIMRERGGRTLPSCSSRKMHSGTIYWS